MARDFSGTSQYLTSATLSLSGSASIAARVWFDSLTPGGSSVTGIVVKGQWTADAEGDLALIIRNVGTTAVEAVVQTSGGVFRARWDTSNFSLGQWYSLIARYDESGATIKLYVDGTERASTGTSGSMSNNSHTLAIGAYPNNLDATAFDGRIAEVAFFSGALSTTNIAFIAANAVPAQFSAAAAWRLLGTDSPEPDAIGGLTMTVTGATQIAHPLTSWIIQLNETTTPTEAITVIRNALQVNVNDTTTVTEFLSVLRSGALTLSVSDTTTPTESVQVVVNPLTANLNEATTPIESVAPQLSLQVNVFDTCTTTEYVYYGTVPPRQASVFDTITVTESVSVPIFIIQHTFNVTALVDESIEHVFNALASPLYGAEIFHIFSVRNSQVDFIHSFRVLNATSSGAVNVTTVANQRPQRLIRKATKL